MTWKADEAVLSIAQSALQKAPQTYALGLLGGTFDPPHAGHIAAACAARDQLGLDAVLFIPAGTPVYKLDQRVTPASDRLAMTRRAVEGERGFLVSALEIERGGKTYTADTLRQLKAVLPDNVRLVFIAGTDAALTIPVWRESGTIAELADIAVVTRPGYPLDRSDARFTELMERFRTQIVVADTPDAASSRIRASLIAGNRDSGLMHGAVAAYAQENDLYNPEA